MKYVIVNDNGLEVPIMFPDMMQHVMYRYNDPVSGGRFNIEYDRNNQEYNYYVWGESTSLNLKSRPEDAKIIKHAFEFQG